MLDRLGAVDPFDDGVGAGERGLHVALANPAVVVRAEVRIHRSPLMDLRGVGVERLADVKERRAGFVAHVNRPHRGVCQGLGLRGHGRHGWPL